MEQHEEMLSPEEQYAQLAPTLDANGFSLYAAAEEATGLKVYEEFPYEDNHGMFEMADGHTLLRYLEAAYFGTVTWEIVPGTPYERAILGEVDKTTPEYRAFYQKICAGAAAHIKKRIGKEMKNVKLIGIHSHIGSQITDMSSFRNLVIRFNEIQEELEAHGVTVENLNFGGGLGIDYYHPNHLSIPAFDNYFAAIHKLLQVRPGQQVHFEPGRSIVAQCGTLISKVLYVKEGETKKFAILDAGFTELIRPAMYDAYHRIENISSDEAVETYDVVGPICESSDVFGKDVELNKAHRGDLIALRSAGAYGEVMASQYNCRHLPKAYYSDTIK